MQLYEMALGAVLILVSLFVALCVVMAERPEKSGAFVGSAQMLRRRIVKGAAAQRVTAVAVGAAGMVALLLDILAAHV